MVIAKRTTAIDARRAPLSKERVLRAAMSLADRQGIDALTMRRLAQDLGVEAMSLYYYVANKDELLAGIADLVVSEIEPPSDRGDWKAAVRRSAISFHDALVRHGWAAATVPVTSGISFARLRYMNALLGRLREAGFSADMTDHAYHALDSHIFGSTMWASSYAAVAKASPDLGRNVMSLLTSEELPYLKEHIRQHMKKRPAGAKGQFEFGLDLILDGLERLRKAGRRPAS